VWAVGAFVSGLIAVRLLSSRTVESAPRVDMGDGHVVEILGTTFGKTHMYREGRWPDLDYWRRRHSWMQGVLGKPTVNVTTTSQTDALCAFHAPLTNVPAGERAAPWIVAAYDSHGCRFSMSRGRGSTGVEHRQVTHQFLESYPRREAEFDVEFEEESGNAKGIRVRVKNPKPWSGQDWVPEPMPAVREVDGLRFGLLRFGDGRTSVYPVFRVERDGVEQKEWMPREVYFWDATGNRSYVPELCRLEPAWKVAVAFARRPETLTSTNEVWLLDGLESPAEAELKELPGDRSLDGVRVRSVWLAGPGRYRFTQVGTSPLKWVSSEKFSASSRPPRRETSSTSSGVVTGTEHTISRVLPWVGLNLTGLGADQVWDLALRNGDGKWLSHQGWSGMGGGFHAVDFRDVKLAKTTGLRLTVQRLKRVEFVVKPPAEHSDQPRMNTNEHE
jgi:hypothetical protein